MSGVETFELAPGYAISRVIRGGWQLAGGHGPIDRAAALDDLIAAFDAGIFTFDCADIYTGVEELYGEMRARLLRDARDRGGEAASGSHQIRAGPRHSAKIDRARRRGDHRPIAARLERRGARSGAVPLVGLRRAALARGVSSGSMTCGAREKCAISAPRISTRAICGKFSTADIPLVSMQAQYSLIDSRPERGLAALCGRTGSGSCATARSQADSCPTAGSAPPSRSAPLANRSLTKYKLIIDEFGGWPLFQELLAALRRIADRHGVDVATVASAAGSQTTRRRRRHRRRDVARASRRQRRGRRDPADSPPTMPRLPPSRRGASAREAMSMSSSAIAAAGTARS